MSRAYARTGSAESMDHDLLWLGRLRRALTEDLFVLHAQPIVDLATATVVQHELLIRMIGDDGALIAPYEFLPTAERYGLIPDVDRWVLHAAAALVAKGHAVQINISAGTLSDPDIGACAERELVDAGAPASRLAFEITETALIGNEALAAGFVDRVRSLGCRVALDDFGTGYAGFHYLKSFRVDCLKIDREFIADLLTDPTSRQVVKAVVQLAAGFGLQTVAEGVEDGATLDELRALDVGYAQGFYFGRPAPALEVLAATGRVLLGGVLS